jgi:DNA-binding SARP family transcriptional activator
MTDDNESVIADAIDAAEDIRDPLEGLAERTVADPGAPFMSEALERLAALKKEDRAAFEALRAQLKKAGCRVTALDEAIAEENGDIWAAEGRRRPTS